MILKLVLLVFWLIPFQGSAVINSGCETALKTLFSEKISQPQASEFLRLQADLTLHRMAWAYLKAQQSDHDESLQNIEGTILTLLDEKYTSTDREFIKARELFENQPLSRTALAEIAPFLKNVLFQEYSDESAPFILNASDLKLLHTLSRYEKKTAKNGIFESRMLARNSPSGMLNFAKLINSSYKTNVSPEESALNVEIKLEGLQPVISEMQKRLNDFINKLDIPSQCTDLVACEIVSDVGDLFNQSEIIQNIFWDSLADKLLTDDLLLDSLTFGETWLKTASQATLKINKPQKEKKVVVAGKEKTTMPSIVRTHFSSSTGLYIEDPVAIILKDKVGRTASSWQSFDKEYLQKMMDAILNDDKVFELKGKLFDRISGKVISLEKALEKLPPKKRAEFKAFLTSNDSHFLSKQVASMVNGDKTFTLGEKLYGIKGNKLSAAQVVSDEMTKKKGILHPVKNYKGMENGYLILRAEALSNNKPHFKYKNEVFDTETGRNINSPFRSLATTEDMKVSKKKRIQYQELSNKEVVINFHRDNPDKSGCQHYAIIDKVNTDLSVYDLSGNILFKAEVLVGNVKSDERTYWTKYDDSEKMTNRSTGAGIYSVKPPTVNNKYYQRNFNNNILQLSGENGKSQVFAVHQVPNGMPERYNFFGSNPDKRRVSSGCANLRLEDFKKISTWIKPSCKIYVLPEETKNKFMVKDGTLRMIADGYVSNPGRYNFNINNSYHRIDMRITNPAGSTPKSEAFIKALEDEKEKLMGIFKLSNDDYNELASLSYAIMGNESDFGRSHKYWYKEHFQGDVIIAKAAKRLFSGKDPFDKSVVNTSRGFTQIKEFPKGSWQKFYPTINKANLDNPKNSAITTIAYLAEAVKSLKRIALENSKNPKKVKITRENIVDYLGYIYQGRRGALTSSNEPANADFNTYVQGLRRNMSYLEVSQKIE